MPESNPLTIGDTPQASAPAPFRKGGGEKLSRKMHALIASLMTEKTYLDAARKVGIGEATVYRWMKLPVFAEAFRSARRAVVDTAVSDLAKLASDAVACLRANMTTGDANSEVRAALGVLDRVQALLVADDFEDRLAALETRLAPNGGRIP